MKIQSYKTERRKGRAAAAATKRREAEGKLASPSRSPAGSSDHA